MKSIFLSIQNKLATINTINYIDKDWGQLQYEQPPVQWPAVLLDVEQVNYTQMGRGAQRADADITVTVANINLQRSSAAVASAKRANAYATIDLLDEIHQQLQHFTSEGKFSPLMRTNLRKVFINDNYEVYAMTYRTSFTVPLIESGKTTVQASLYEHKEIIADTTEETDEGTDETSDEENGQNSES